MPPEYQTVNTLEQVQDYLFCTMAIGRSYYQFALNLIADLEQYAPDHKLLILTDRPHLFKAYPNVIVCYHRPHTIHLLFDKVFVIRKAMTLSAHCIFLDADVRIRGPVPSTITFPPGITAYSCFPINKLYSSDSFHGGDDPHKVWLRQIVQGAADSLGVNLDQVSFIWEYYFYVTRHPRIFDMLDTWQELADFYESRGRPGGEGEALGIAAAKYDIPVNYDEEKVIPFFKNRVELWLISQGKARREDSQQYFEGYQRIKYPKRSLPQKVIDKVSYKAGILYRTLRFRWRRLMS